MWTGGTSAIIAEHLLTAALHGRAAESPLNPVLAFRALLTLGSTNEANKCSLLLIEVHNLSIFTAGHIPGRSISFEAHSEGSNSVSAPALRGCSFIEGIPPIPHDLRSSLGHTHKGSRDGRYARTRAHSGIRV